MDHPNAHENAMHVVAEFEASAFDSSSLCAVCGQFLDSDIIIRNVNLECHSETNIVNTSNVTDGGN